MNYLLLIIVGGAGIWLGHRLATRGRVGGAEEVKPSTQFDKKKGNKERVLKLLRERGSIMNDDVERELSVSDATATNYLQELENEGRVRQIGSTGRSVRYELK